MAVAEHDSPASPSAIAPSFLLQRVQPAMTGLIDESLSTRHSQVTHACGRRTPARSQPKILR
jgi:hypothetical protein